MARRSAARVANSWRMAWCPYRINGWVMTGTREATGAGGTGDGSSGAGAGVFNIRLRNRRGDGVGNGGGDVGGASPAAAKRRATTKIAIPPRMNGVSVTGGQTCGAEGGCSPPMPLRMAVSALRFSMR
jgi:hypothetical protein